jgi:cell wall-associated NlpC family hydrolase
LKKLRKCCEDLTRFEHIHNFALVLSLLFHGCAPQGALTKRQEKPLADKHLHRKFGFALLLCLPAASVFATDSVDTSLARPAAALMSGLSVYAPGPALAQAAFGTSDTAPAAAAKGDVKPGTVEALAMLDEDEDMPAEGVAVDSSSVAGNDPRHVLLQLAMKLRDIRYRRGGDTPSTGFDCSGFVRYVFSHSLGLDLPANSGSQFASGLKVNRGDMKPGDLVFFRIRGKRVSHVGIYIANGQFIHSPSTGKTVRVDSLQEAYWSRRFAGAKRPDGIARI